MTNDLESPNLPSVLDHRFVHPRPDRREADQEACAMSNRTAHGAVMQSGSHTARGATRELIQLAGRVLPPPPLGRTVPRQGKDRAPFYPAADSLVGQREDRLSEMFPPAGGRAAQAGLYVSGQGNSLSHSFPTRAALKLAQLADTVFNVFSGLLIALFVLLLFASPFIALGCLLFVSFN